MRAALAFLKSNLFNIICGVVVMASVGLGVLGVTKMSEVDKQLKGIQTLHGQFTTAMKDPVNEKTIEAERTRVETVRGNYGKLLEAANGYNRFEPLAPPEGAVFFPEPSQAGKLQFRDIYLAQFDRLLDRLNSGTPPTQADIDQMTENMREEANAAESFAVDETDDADKDKPADTAMTKEELNKSGLITTKAARESAPARAAITKAKNFYCYADRKSFQINPQIEAGRISSEPADMWAAQTSLWIQQDVVESIARLNEGVANELKEKGEEAWVGVLPVKDVISIRVSGYHMGEAKGGTGNRDVFGSEPSDPPGSSESVFTKNKSTDLYELVQFTLKMVVDVRELPRIIDAICKDRFHTVLNVEYAYAPSELESLNMTGRIYGPQPAVKVLIDFETVFFGDIYRRMMPDVVLKAIGKTRPGEESGKK